MCGSVQEEADVLGGNGSIQMLLLKMGAARWQDQKRLPGTLEFICVGWERGTQQHKIKGPLCQQEMSQTQASYVVEAEGRKKEQSSSQGT